MIFFCKNLSSDSVKILAPRSEESERRLLLDIESFEQIFYLFFIEMALISIEVVNVASNSFTNIMTASFFKDRSKRFNLFHIDYIAHPLFIKMMIVFVTYRSKSSNRISALTV